MSDENEAAWVPSIERNVTDEPYPHRYRHTPDAHVWIGTRTADIVQAFIDAASRPEPLGLRVWIDEDAYPQDASPHRLLIDLSAIIGTKPSVVAILSQHQVDTLRAAFPELHPGVSRNADGSLSAPGAAVRTLPEGWEWSVDGRVWNAGRLSVLNDARLYYVRPPQTRTELVEIRFSLDREHERDGKVIAVGRDDDGDLYADFASGRRVHASDAEGMVEVLAEVPR